ncbi:MULTISPECIES: histidine kinase [Bacillaceae]|uniref:histidine kinase n=1 Tax=Bacillaceae TaxID=186817 RepID=UPI001CFEED1F|nr:MULTISPECIES: histidine kinase [Rossellomorea]MDX8342739.1 histidine kinase [Rossellomorea sp. YZS02]
MDKRFTMIIPIMILVAVASYWMLGKYYSEIELGSKIMLIIGGTLLSGVISFFLFKEDKEPK